MYGKGVGPAIGCLCLWLISQSSCLGSYKSLDKSLIVDPNYAEIIRNVVVHDANDDIIFYATGTFLCSSSDLMLV